MKIGKYVAWVAAIVVVTLALRWRTEAMQNRAAGFKDSLTAANAHLGADSFYWKTRALGKIVPESVMVVGDEAVKRCTAKRRFVIQIAANEPDSVTLMHLRRSAFDSDGNAVSIVTRDSTRAIAVAFLCPWEMKQR